MLCFSQKGGTTMDQRILIAEDEPRLLAILCDYFRSRGDFPTPAKNGLEALEAAEQGEFDGVLLDIMMPGLNGLSVCRAIRKNSDVPIIFLTALSDEEDKLLGYELGADDYVTKPFSLSVLYAKTMALIKRNQRRVLGDTLLEGGGIAVDLATRRVTAAGKEAILTPKEYALLCCLLQNKNAAVSREQLLVKCWGYDYEGDIRAVDTHIKRLREKLGGCADCIKTVIKIGYRLEG